MFFLPKSMICVKVAKVTRLKAFRKRNGLFISVIQCDQYCSNHEPHNKSLKSNQPVTLNFEIDNKISHT